MQHRKSIWISLATAAPIAFLGGLMGLGGAEFRLPVLVGIFQYQARRAVALNLAVSLVTILSSLVFRLPKVDFSLLISRGPIILSLLGGSMTGAYLGAAVSHKVTEAFLKKVILLLLVLIGLLMIAEGFHPLGSRRAAVPGTGLSAAIGVVLGLGIGFVSSLLGVAGGELIIPTLILAFGVEIKLAGTASMFISLPTIIVGLIKHASQGAYQEKRDLTGLVLPMGIASIIGAFLGTSLISYVSEAFLKILLGFILIASALKIFLRREPEAG